METKIIKAVFGGGRYAVTTKRTRTDYGQVLEFVGVDLPDTFECIFSNSNTSAGVGKKQIGSAQRVLIPDEYLATGQTIYAWVLVHDSEDDGRHIYNVKIPVDDMPDTSPEEPTPVEQSVISQAITALNTAVDTTSQNAQEASDSADRAEQAAEGIEAYAERAEAAQNASESARDIALEAKVSAQASAATATEKASEAISSATTASQSAITAESASESAQEYATASAESASASAESASQASEHANTAGSKATEASGYASSANTSANTANTKASEAAQSASTATQAKMDAESAKTASQTAQTASESARDGAVTAKADAESARDEAQSIADSISGKVEQIDSNTERIESLEDDRYKPYPTDSASGSIASFPDGADDIPLKSCIVQVEPVQEGSGDPSPDNIRPITGWTGAVVSHSGADMSDPTTYPITFPSEAGTVYGAHIDVINGELVVDSELITLKGSELFWSNIATTSGVIRAYTTPFFSGRNVIVSDSLMHLKSSVVLNAMRIGDGRLIITPSWMQGVTTLAEFKTLLAEHNINIVVSLATPIHYPLTSNQINSLLGQNNIWADTGDTEVEYRADTKLYIEKLTQPEENDMIADSAISEGQFFMIGNSLYRALANIASGATITVGTNAERVSLSDALNLVNA